MRNLVLAAIGSATLGLFAAAPASAAPLAAGGSALSHQIEAPVQDVAWRNVCKTRTVWRRDRWGNPVRVKARDCDRVWVGPPRPYAGAYNGKRYYRNGYYYRDPGFTIRIN